jgi:hypothetical protein
MKRIRYAVLLVLVYLVSCLQAHETEGKTPAPGYRLESEYSDAFVDSVGASQMVVYPTIVRIKTPDGIVTSHNRESQKAILDHLSKKGIVDSNGLDLSRSEGQAQYDFFLSSMKLMAEQIKQPYHLAEEVIIIQRSDNHLAVFGIHIYILDQAGHNAFSFLLNSHHQLFVDAKLYSDDNLKESVDKLVAQSTRVALQALELQIKQAKQTDTD